MNWLLRSLLAKGFDCMRDPTDDDDGAEVRRRVHLFSFRFRRPTLGADQLQQLMLQMLNNQNTALQQQQNQMNFLMQAQSAQLTLLNRRLDEEEARRKAEEARRTVSADPFLQQAPEVVQEQLYRRLPGSPVAPPSVLVL
eukprot:s2367_g10.t1